MKPGGSVLCQEDHKKAGRLNYEHQSLSIENKSLLTTTPLVTSTGQTLALWDKRQAYSGKQNLHEWAGISRLPSSPEVIHSLGVNWER